MFSPDNFYDFIDSCYGINHGNVILTFRPHGSKNFADLGPYAITENLDSPDPLLTSDFGCVILHDQEPFETKALDTYRDWCNLETNRPQHFHAVTNVENLLHKLQTCSWPIICHSEKNSDDIDQLRRSGFLDCHYFYHGMISRDWFRRWKYFPETRLKLADRYRFLVYARDWSGTRTYRKTLINSLRPWQEHVLYHNWTDKEPIVSSDHAAKICFKDFALSSIHIVAETLFDSTKIHLTEKIFKPIVMRQPFLLLAGPGALAYLRDYGFKTFDSVWDESYDNDHDSDSRMFKIIEIVKKLMACNNTEFDALIRKCDSIVEHNHKHFFSAEFEKLMLSEMTQNLQGCIERQRQLQIEDPGGSLFYTLDCYHQRDVFMHQKLVQRTRNVVNFLHQHRVEQFQSIQSRYEWVNKYVG